MMESGGVPFTMNVEPSGCNNGGMGGWGDGGWLWFIIVIFALFGGWGNGGFGGNGGQALTRGELCQDMNFNDVQSGVRDIQNNLQNGFRNIDNAVCTLGYNNAQLANGIQMQIGSEFRGLDNAVCTLGYNTQQGFNQTNLSLMQGQNALQSQLAQCCCDNRAGQKDIEYAIATNACAINTNASNNTRDLLENANANTRAILDKLTSQEIEAKNAEIARQNQQIFQLQLAASQEKQNNYLVNQLRPCPIPSYPTCNPWASTYNYGYNGCSGCGCNG